MASGQNKIYRCYSMSMARGIVDCEQQGRPEMRGCTRVAFCKPAGYERWARACVICNARQEESASDD
jgi:hypothetical protein